MPLKTAFFKKNLIKLLPIKRFEIYKNYIYDYPFYSKPYLYTIQNKESKIEPYIVEVFTQMIISCNLFWRWFWCGKVLQWQLA